MQAIEILLIEDNPGDVELTREALTRGKIRNLLSVVCDGEQALEHLAQLQREALALPDIILLDLNLPKIDGRQVLKVIKNSPELQHIPTIILSSSEDAIDIQDSYDLHANCFITKPVKLQNFMQVIQMIEHFWVEIVKLPK